MTIPAGAIAVGSHFYLFKSSTNKEDCLISAHGGYERNVTTFAPKGCTLYFYGEHGKVLSDPGLSLMAIRGLKVVEQVPDTGKPTAINYILSKYQGRHSGANETYDKIAGRIGSEDAQIAKLRQRIAAAASEKLRQGARQQLAYYQSMNVLTVRNRWWRSDLSLETAVTEARAAMPSLIRFHCSFCRSLIGDDKAGTSKVQFA